MTTTETVRIPPDYFKTSVTKTYSNVQTALIRELLQNSIDAKATKIDCVAQNGLLIWQDNGHGMSKSRMIEAMLTMGGSVKEEGAVGGFGEAKILILFAQKAFEIVSLDTAYAGEGLTYWPISHKYLQGTKITLTLADIPQLTYFLESNIREFIANCNLAPGIKISVNGVRAKSNSSLGKALINLEELGTIYQRKWKRNESKSRGSILVQHNGVNMFSHYTGSTSERIVLDLKNSTETMTSNRDGFNYKFEWRFSNFIKNLVQSDGKLNPVQEDLITVYGREEVINFIKSLDRARFDRQQNQGLEDLTRALETQTKPPTEVWERCFELFENSPELTSSLDKLRAKSEISADFIIFKGPLKKVPKKFHPDTMGKKEKIIAILWKKCLTMIFEEIERSQAFNIGWSFDPEVSASITKNEEYHKVLFLLNPQNFDYKVLNKDVFYHIFLCAIHEVTHLFQEYHGESFVAEFHKILLKTYEIPNSWELLTKQAKREEL